MPSVVWLPVATGFGVVLQQMPRAVMGALPSLLILPPLAAVVFVIDVPAVVVSVGMLNKIGSGLNSFWQLNATSDSRIMMLRVFM